MNNNNDKAPAAGIWAAAFDRFNRLPAWAVVFGALTLAFILLPVQSNENHYFSLAKAFMDPDWLPDSFVAREPAGTRLLFQVVFGALLRAFDFEVVLFIGRLTTYLFYGFALERLARALGLSNFALLFGLVPFFFQQRFFAAEWMFMGAEAKTFAYGFALLSLSAYCRARNARAVLFAVCATYLHVLVGGWLLLAFGLAWTLWPGGPSWSVRLRLAGGYALAVAPMAAYLLAHLLETRGASGDGPSADWIYVYFRNPHHLAPFADMGEFRRKFLPGICFAAATCGALFYLRIKLRTLPGAWRRALEYAIVVLGLTLAFVVVAYFDTEGRLLKFYPFRQQALALLLSLLFAAWLFVRALETRAPRRAGFYKRLALIGVTLPLLLYLGNRSRLWRQDRLQKSATRFEAYDCARQASPPDARFILLEKKVGFEHVDFLRRTDRDAYVLFKMVPAGGAPLLEWYDRLQKTEAMKQDYDLLVRELGRDNAGWALADFPIRDERLQEVCRHGHYHVYRLR